VILGWLYKLDTKVVGSLGRDHGMGQYEIVWAIFFQKKTAYTHVPYPSCNYNTSLANGHPSRELKHKVIDWMNHMLRKNNVSNHTQ
jgi:hypothetical protein